MYPIIRHRVQSHRVRAVRHRRTVVLVLAGPIRPALPAAPRVGRLRTPARRPDQLLPARPIRSLAPEPRLRLCSPPLDFQLRSSIHCDRQIERTVAHPTHPNSPNPQLLRFFSTFT